MRTSLRRYLGTQIACITLWPVLVIAQSTDLAQNLSACKNGWASCDRSKLTRTESGLRVGGCQPPAGGFEVPGQLQFLRSFQTYRISCARTVHHKATRNGLPIKIGTAQ